MNNPKNINEQHKISKTGMLSGVGMGMLISSAVLFSSGMAFAQDGAALFKQNCGVCHTIGKGRLVGPDLKGVTQKRNEKWLMSWTKSSQAFIKTGDPDAKAIFDEFQTPMPDQNLPDGEIKAIYAFVEGQSGSGAVAAADTVAKPAQVVRSTDNATADEINAGKGFFDGSVRLSNGGAACISCHNVNYNGIIPGGLLAKDLTTVHSRLGGDAGLLGILGAPPFPAMTQAYKNNALSESEIFAITAFLNKVDKDVANQIVSPSNPLLKYGPIAFAILMVLIFGMFFGRKKYTVKKEIYNRQIKSF